MSRRRQKGAAGAVGERFLMAEAEVPVQLAHDVVGQLAQLPGRHLGALRYMGGREGDEVVRRDQRLVERRQQVGIGGGVEVRQDVQQVGHG